MRIRRWLARWSKPAPHPHVPMGESDRNPSATDGSNVQIIDLYGELFFVERVTVEPPRPRRHGDERRGKECQSPESASADDDGYASAWAPYRAPAPAA